MCSPLQTFSPSHLGTPSSHSLQSRAPPPSSSSYCTCCPRDMASSSVSVQGLRAPLLLPSVSCPFRGNVPLSQSARTAKAAPAKRWIRAATQGGGGTKIVGVKKVKGGTTTEPAAIKILSRVEQLRLLSKAEKAGLLSAAENAGFSLSSIEKLGLLSKAEEFGALSAATDRKTPSLLLIAALGLLVLGPAVVYFVPEDSTSLIVLQVVVATVSVLGGSAAFAASSFVSALQSSE